MDMSTGNDTPLLAALERGTTVRVWLPLMKGAG